MKKSIQISWTGGMSFEASIDEHKIMMDAPPAVGGEGKGTTPKPLLMASLGGCTGMDVISIAKKMKQDVSRFEIEMTGELTEEHPMHYTSIHLIYRFWGQDLDPEKLNRAIELSQDKYCGVNATLKKAMAITYEAVVEK